MRRKSVFLSPPHCGSEIFPQALYRTNLANLEDNILPTRPRATLILKKERNHLIETVALRRL